jgi:hypothetical protein
MGLIAITLFNVSLACAALPFMPVDLDGLRLSGEGAASAAVIPGPRTKPADYVCPMPDICIADWDTINGNNGACTLPSALPCMTYAEYLTLNNGYFEKADGTWEKDPNWVDPATSLPPGTRKCGTVKPPVIAETKPIAYHCVAPVPMPNLGEATPDATTTATTPSTTTAATPESATGDPFPSWIWIGALAGFGALGVRRVTAARAATR